MNTIVNRVVNRITIHQENIMANQTIITFSTKNIGSYYSAYKQVCPESPESEILNSTANFLKDCFQQAVNQVPGMQGRRVLSGQFVEGTSIDLDHAAEKYKNTPPNEKFAEWLKDKCPPPDDNSGGTSNGGAVKEMITPSINTIVRGPATINRQIVDLNRYRTLQLRRSSALSGEQAIAARNSQTHWYENRLLNSIAHYLGFESPLPLMGAQSVSISSVAMPLSVLAR